MFLKLILGSFAMVIVIVIAVAILKRAKPRNSDLLFDLKTFEPNELDRLKAKGLLSDDEAKRVQAVVAERAMEWSEELRKQRESAPIDMNTLLAEAEKYRRSYDNTRSPGNDDSEEDPKE